jgi:hypothetical protein
MGSNFMNNRLETTVLRLPLAAAILLATALPSAAETPKPNARQLIKAGVIEEIRKWTDTEIVRVAVNAQNARIGDVDQVEIDRLDLQWRAEREADDKPLIAATLSNPLSVYLSRMQGRSVGLYTEIFVMDKNGLNVGQSSITSDFWQGDEDKFQKTFQVSNDAVFIDEPEWDDDFKIWRGQVNFTLTDEKGEKPIGAATVEINLSELERRSNASF